LISNHMPFIQIQFMLTDKKSSQPLLAQMTLLNT